MMWLFSICIISSPVESNIWMMRYGNPKSWEAGTKSPDPFPRPPHEGDHMLVGSERGIGAEESTGRDDFWIKFCDVVHGKKLICRCFANASPPVDGKGGEYYSIEPEGVQLVIKVNISTIITIFLWAVWRSTWSFITWTSITVTTWANIPLYHVFEDHQIFWKMTPHKLWLLYGQSWESRPRRRYVVLFWVREWQSTSAQYGPKFQCSTNLWNMCSLQHSYHKIVET